MVSFLWFKVIIDSILALVSIVQIVVYLTVGRVKYLKLISFVIYIVCVIIFFAKSFFNLIELNKSFPGCGKNDALISAQQKFWLNIVNWAAFIVLNEVVIGIHLFFFGCCVLLFLK